MLSCRYGRHKVKLLVLIAYKIGLGNVFKRNPGPIFFCQPVDELERNESIEPAVESSENCISGFVLPLESFP